MPPYAKVVKGTKSNSSAHSIVFQSLNSEQHGVVEDARKKGSGCIKVYKGGGKTRISMTIALENGNRTIVICTNSVANTFIEEIGKVFGSSARRYKKGDGKSDDNVVLNYAVLSGSSKLPEDWVIPDGPFILIATTPYISERVYTRQDSDFKHIVSHINAQGERKTVYNTATTPAFPQHKTGALSVFSIVWDTLLIDESQTYQNIESDVVLTICSIAARHRWALSGSPIKNVSPGQYLAYYAMIGANVPRSKGELKQYMSNPNFGGLKETMIVRDEQTMDVELKSHIVSHSISTEEALIFTMFRRVLGRLTMEISKAQTNKYYNTIDELNGSLLTAVDYLRQAVAFPMMPIVSVLMKMSTSQARTPIVKIINEELGGLGLQDWLMNASNACSSRMKAVLEVLRKLDEPCVIFVAYKRTANLIAHYIKDRPCFLFTGDVPVENQSSLFEKFRQSKNGALVMTYRKGSTSLNLQNASSVLIVDLEWSVIDGEQALARVFRQGQTRDVSVYYFTSNTGIEAGVLRKQSAKRVITDQVLEGPIKGQCRSIPIKKFVDELIVLEDNVRVMKELYFTLDDKEADAKEPCTKEPCTKDPNINNLPTNTRQTVN